MSRQYPKLGEFAPYLRKCDPEDIPKTGMRASAILRRAAERVLMDQQAGCGAISIGIRDNRHWDAKERARAYYSNLFANDYSYWFGGVWTRSNQEHRTTALLLAADMAESVGD